MNENIDLTKILKDCPKGWKFYSSIYGDVEFLGVSHGCPVPLHGQDDERYFIEDFRCKKYPIRIKTRFGEYEVSNEGKLRVGAGECILFPSRNQRDWSKFTAPWYKKDKLVKTKFKVGDRIRHKDTNKDDVYEISKVYCDSYGIVGFSWMINMEYQDQYELVPNKFDPKTLKPFDRVLIKDVIWSVGFFSHYNKNACYYPCECVGGTIAKYCIPYNDDTKHLVGTTDEAPEYYRYWDD